MTEDNLINHFMLQEAIHSVALEHANCECTVCRAADGDEKALAQIYKQAGKQGFAKDE